MPRVTLADLIDRHLANQVVMREATERARASERVLIRALQSTSHRVVIHDRESWCAFDRRLYRQVAEEYGKLVAEHGAPNARDVEVPTECLGETAEAKETS